MSIADRFTDREPFRFLGPGSPGRARHIVLVTVLAGLGAVQAAPIGVTAPYQFIDTYGSNTIGVTAMTYDEFGAFATPTGAAGTTAVAVRGAFTTTVPWVGGTANPTQFNRLIAYDPANTGAFQITFANGNDRTVVTTPTITGATLTPPVQNIQIASGGTNPTFTWTVPAGVRPDDIRINIYDHGRTRLDGNGVDLVYSRDFAGTTTSFTVPGTLAGGLPLQLDNRYTLEIAIVDTRSNGLATSQSDLLSRSRTFVDFVPVPANAPAVYLPVVTPGINGAAPVFTFDITHVSDQLIYIDPLIATGYDYAIGAGNPNFRSVLLPTGIGDGFYDLMFGNQSVHIAGGTSFDFGVAGVPAFRVRGIEFDAALLATDPTAFITGVTFTREGAFTGTMVPLVVAVPEPESYALMLAGLGLVVTLARRRTRAAR